MSHTPTNTKRYSHACEYYIVYTTKVPNIVTVLLVTVSVGNIVLVDKGGGLLIDWELVKMVDNNKSRQPDHAVSLTA